ncbi:hypothetical protein GCM10029964_068530 [Kibdelosporangium lantanae]
MTAGTVSYRDLGLAAGLRSVLDGINPATIAPHGVAVLPGNKVPGGARIVPNLLAAREGLVVARFGTPGPGGGLRGSGPPRSPRCVSGCSPGCWISRWSGCPDVRSPACP